MNKALCLAFLASLFISLGGCATLYGDNTRQVVVNSNPQGAEVYLNNKYMGMTPTNLILDNIWNTNYVQLKKKGYSPINTTINSKLQPVALWDIVFVPGFIIDGFSGDFMKIPPESRNITLDFAPHA